MHKTVVLNVVGLTHELLGEHTPRLRAFREQGASASVEEAFPAVTCSAQSTYLTGRPPTEHGIVGNGWYFRDTCEIKFWHQSNKLVQAPPIWEAARREDPSFRVANLFWWFNMYSSADIAVTPRPMYPADGRKIPDIWTAPAGLRDELQQALGRFPLFEFWGPGASINSSRWIARAAMHTEEHHAPTLTLVYLPHLDYGLQKYGPDAAEIDAELEAIDQVCGELIDFYQARGARVMVVSEYGVGAVELPVHINRRLREAGLITVREELGGELLDAGASQAFAVADHQVAHIYINRASAKEQVRELLEATPGVAAVLDDEAKQSRGVAHRRAGDLMAVAEPEAWFTYYYWTDDRRAPDFARTVDIHRKPGYDPVELFVDPELRFPKLRLGRKLLKKKLGMRYLMDVIGLDPSLVKGSHGIRAERASARPVVMTDRPDLLEDDEIEATHVYELIGRHLGLASPARGDLVSVAPTSHMGFRAT